MTQADCVLSTPPTNTSARHSRRSILGAIAGSAAAAGGIAALALPNAKASEPDPIYAAIEAHRKAGAASCAASAEIRRLYDLADEIAGPREIDIPSMLEPGTTVKASIWLDIEQAIPSAKFPEQYAYYLALLNERSEAHYAVTGDTDPIGEEEYAAEWDALDEFADTVPTTLAGLLAMMIYAAEVRERDCGAFTDRRCALIENLATAAKAMIEGGRQ
jgi:hypothetical protein